MLISVDISTKSFGNNILYKDLSFDIQKNEKVGLVGRNGTGKSTLLNMITGDDVDYAGEVKIKSGTVVVSGRQEHHGHEDKTIFEYIQGDLPEYSKLTEIIDTYPDKMSTDTQMIQQYSDALERFNHLNYYQLEDNIKQAIDAYQLEPKILHRKMSTLSGGQVRMVELIKVQRSRGDIALIDEPTNHMDYVAKDSFIKWLKAADESVLVITHDRDVLKTVGRIIEIRDGRSYNFKGNYDDYLRINKSQVTAQVNEYDISQQRIKNLRNDIVRFRRLKEKARNPGTIRRFKSQERKAQDELAILVAQDKPAFWIDQESATDMSPKMTDAYEKYKATNISVRTENNNSDTAKRRLIKVDNISLGYDEDPLFSPLSFELREGERLRLHGRNGTGKTTLVQAIMSQAGIGTLSSKCFSGHIEIEQDIRVGLYEQEINPEYLLLSLGEAVEQILRNSNQPISQQKVKQLLSDYLFNPITDSLMPVKQLSGGQKARLQLIAMLANDPHVLVLDEPTNHLDLPSIEEIENALVSYSGAVIYISHDSFFANKLGGKTLKIIANE